MTSASESGGLGSVIAGVSGCRGQVSCCSRSATVFDVSWGEEPAVGQDEARRYGICRRGISFQRHLCSWAPLVLGHLCSRPAAARSRLLMAIATSLASALNVRPAGRSQSSSSRGRRRIGAVPYRTRLRPCRVPSFAGWCRTCCAPPADRPTRSVLPNLGRGRRRPPDPPYSRRL
jgi:hypothetical protein